MRERERESGVEGKERERGQARERKQWLTTPNTIVVPCATPKKRAPRGGKAARGGGGRGTGLRGMVVVVIDGSWCGCLAVTPCVVVVAAF